MLDSDDLLGDASPVPQPLPLPTWANRLAVFDLETTGVDTRQARIVTACFAVIDESGAILTESDWLADPGVEIPWQAERVHGISTERARREGRPVEEVVSEVAQAVLQSFRDGIPVVAYNAPYDFGVLRSESRRHGVAVIGDPAPIVDPLVLDRAMDKFRRGKRTLSAACEVYGVTLEDAHTANADAVAAGRVAQAIARRYPERLTMSSMDLHLAEQAWAREQAASFAEYRRRTGGAPVSAVSRWPVR